MTIDAFILKKITVDNVHDHIGKLCLFWTRGMFVIRRILRASASGKTALVAFIEPEYESHTHYIQLVTRRVYQIVDIQYV